MYKLILNCSFSECFVHLSSIIAQSYAMPCHAVIMDQQSMVWSLIDLCVCVCVGGVNYS